MVDDAFDEDGCCGGPSSVSTAMSASSLMALRSLPRGVEHGGAKACEDGASGSGGESGSDGTREDEAADDINGNGRARFSL